tara:strand:- start:7 stop:792 length:786 start_codon:yes stop_codon:yes gene_type:complete
MNIVKLLFLSFNLSFINSFLTYPAVIINKPAGYFGFYTLGVTAFIKKNYNLDNFDFVGTSAGAWNSLYSCYNGNSKVFIKKLLNEVDDLEEPTLYEVQKCLKKSLLEYTTDEDYNLKKLYIGVTVAQKINKLEGVLYNDFESLEDAIDCCIASSHIPLVTGGLINKYKGKISFDGGLINFNNNKLIKDREILFEINAALWNNNPELNGEIQNTSPSMLQSALQPEKISFSSINLYNAGWRDSCKNKKALDTIFIPKIMNNE